jgi:Transport and Golgi organisation 2
MCTLSIIRLPDHPRGFRVVFSRDEQRSRSDGLPPRWRRTSAQGVRVRAAWPTDPDGGGTWIGASERGLVMALLNYNEHDSARRSEAEARGTPAVPSPSSRGLLIPNLIASENAARSADALSEMDLASYAPFRLVSLSLDLKSDGLEAVVSAWNGRDLSRAVSRETSLCFVSSGLGDRLVAPRLDLFRAMVADRATPDAQDLFHAHRWPDRPKISVLMTRPDARTVSQTTVIVRDGMPDALVRLHYRPIPSVSAAEALLTHVRHANSS